MSDQQGLQEEKICSFKSRIASIDTTVCDSGITLWYHSVVSLCGNSALHH